MNQNKTAEWHFRPPQEVILYVKAFAGLKLAFCCHLEVQYPAFQLHVLQYINKFRADVQTTPWFHKWRIKCSNPARLIG